MTDAERTVCCEDCGGTDDEYLLVGTVLFCRREACKRAAHDEHASLMRRVSATEAARSAALRAWEAAHGPDPQYRTPNARPEGEPS